MAKIAANNLCAALAVGVPLFAQLAACNEVVEPRNPLGVYRSDRNEAGSPVVGSTITLKAAGAYEGEHNTGTEKLSFSGGWSLRPRSLPKNSAPTKCATLSLENFKSYSVVAGDWSHVPNTTLTEYCEYADGLAIISFYKDDVTRFTREPPRPR